MNTPTHTNGPGAVAKHDTESVAKTPNKELRMNNTDIVTPPADYTQEPEDHELYWGPQHDTHGAQVIASWTVTDGFCIDLEGTPTLSPTEARDLAQTLLELADSMETPSPAQADR